MSEATLRAVEAIVRRELDDPSLELARETIADDVPFWDSVAHVRIMIGVEKEFSLRFTSDELTGFANVGELVDAIDGKRAG